MNNWNNFNSAQEQQSFNIIPAGTIAKVSMLIRPGGHDDPSQGWGGGYATRNNNTGSVYLSCEFVILEGKFARRKVWSLIGLHSPKSEEWANMGRSFIKGILNSARGFNNSDNSESAQKARCINSLADLDSIVFAAKIDVGKDQSFEPKNEIRFAITPDHKDYAAVMETINPQAQENNRPTWAK